MAKTGNRHDTDRSRNNHNKKRQRNSSESDQPNHTWNRRQTFINVICILYILAFAGYIILGKFKGLTTSKSIDLIYFTSVTFTTVGYGDIIPASLITRLSTAILILIGFPLHDIILSCIGKWCIWVLRSLRIDLTRLYKKWKTLIAWLSKLNRLLKSILVLLCIIGSIALGTYSVHFLEHLSLRESFYFTVITVTSVGFGDYTFTTEEGRCCAILWLAISTRVIAWAFSYLTKEIQAWLAAAPNA